MPSQAGCIERRPAQPVAVGAALVTAGTLPRIAGVITRLSRAAFMSGRHAAFLVAAAVALAGAVIGLLVRRGNGTAAAHPGI
jgi:hypothetical protein